jgi:serine/threonine protein kinase
MSSDPMKDLRIGEPIGYGASAAVCEAWWRLPDGTEQPVAVKRLLPGHRDDPALAARFEREAALCMSITHDHPNLISVYDFRRMPDGELVMIMERVDGLSLDRFPPLDPPGVRYILREVARALVFVHAHGVLHRDVSPRNILVARDGTIKVLDFGLARWLEAPRSEYGFKGTASYASPEAIHCMELDPSHDLYSLGAVGYELLTGAPPYGFGDRVQIKQRMTIQDIEPLPDAVPRDLATLIEGLLQPWEERTIRIASQVIDALGEPVAEPQDIARTVARVMESRSDDARMETYPALIGTKQAPDSRFWRAVLLVGVLCACLMVYLALRGESTNTSPEPAEEVSEEAPDASFYTEQVSLDASTETLVTPAPEKSDATEPSQPLDSREPPRKSRNRAKQPEKPKLLPSQQNPEVHIVPKAEIYKHIEEED